MISEIRAMALAALQSGDKTMMEIVEATGRSESAIKRAVTRLREAGQIHVANEKPARGRGAAQWIYTLGAAPKDSPQPKIHPRKKTGAEVEIRVVPAPEIHPIAVWALGVSSIPPTPTAAPIATLGH